MSPAGMSCCFFHVLLACIRTIVLISALRSSLEGPPEEGPVKDGNIIAQPPAEGPEGKAVQGSWGRKRGIGGFVC